MNDVFRVRIGKVTPKANIRLLPKVQHSDHADCVDAFRGLPAKFEAAMTSWAGWMVIAWNADGTWACAHRLTPSSPYARHFLPGIAADAVRSEITVPKIIREVQDSP